VHKLLARQLRRFFGSADAVPESLRPFVAAVEEAYRQSDDDRAMLEHSMDTVSAELADRFQKLRGALEQRDEVNQALSILAATLESTADGILVVDLHGQIIRSNSRFAALWRIPESVLLTQDDAAALEVAVQQLEDPDAFSRKVRELYGEPDRESIDVLQFKDGRVYERYSMPQRVRGVTVGRVWSFRDITARRQLEEQLRQSQKMEAIGQLAGGVAHDFNNLLTVIRTHAEFLEEEIAPETASRDYASEIIKAAQRAAELTRQLLAFSRRQMLKPVLFDISAVVASEEPMLRRLIGEDIEIITTFAPEPAVVSADPGQMEQVLMNLVLNARDALPRGGQIVIETAHVCVDEKFERTANDLTPAGEYVRLSVSDNGIGIPREQIDRVFEPFFTTKEVGKGTGLGLSTLYGIVKQSGGYIWVDSEVGVQTTFRIYLPRGQAGDVEATESPRARPASGGPETILLAEDEDAVRRLVRRILEMKGYTVLDARHGNDALAVSAHYPARIDLLLTDVIMPELGGRELVERMRQDRPGIRVLYMSGYTNSEIDRRGLLQPDTVFLHKPFSGSDLLLAVRSALDSGVASAQ
jgi:PAS domain S-box-containing protein